MATKSELVTVDKTLTGLAGALTGMVLDAVDSPNTRRAYARALSDFLTWYADGDRRPFNKAAVQRYVAELRSAGMSAANINQRLSAVKKLAAEASDNQAISAAAANGISRVKGVRAEGQRAGNWLTRDQAQRLLNTPSTSTLKGLRDRALLSVLLGCGLRRSEAAGLTFEHVQQRDGRWAICDIRGKRAKVRTVPMPSWSKVAIDAWSEAAGIHEGRVFRAVHKGNRLDGESMSDQAIADVVRLYSKAAGLNGLAAHDARRTFAKLAYRGGAGLDQISLSLGHASLEVTQRYLGLAQNLADAPCDRLGLDLGGE